jgi:hypothetical protein
MTGFAHKLVSVPGSSTVERLTQRMRRVANRIVS